jgi:hypothetical protein
VNELQPVNKQVLFEPFPKQQEFIDAALSGDYTFIVYGGAIRGGKTFALLALFILLARIFPGSRWAIVRKNLPTIKRNLYPSWEKIKPTSFIVTDASDSNQQTVTFKNGSKIIFFPESYDEDKELNRWKGLEVNGFGFEEINECQRASLFKAFERAGSYVIPMQQGADGVFRAVNQPKPLVVGTCNPTQGWLKEIVYNPRKEGALKPGWLYIQSRIYDNVPLLQAQPDYLPSLKSNLTIYEYMVFVEGDWDVQLKTGGEFLRSFELGKHIKPVPFTRGIQLFVSIDSNVYPYISMTFWQLIKRDDGGWKIRQVHEICAEDPDNTASRAAKKAVEWLNDMGYVQRLVMHGDRSTKNRNNIDDKKRSFFQIVNETFINAQFQTEDKVLSFAPPVSSIADFVNAIFEGKVPGLEIEINEDCKKSIADYIETKTDKDGTILKVRIPHPTIPGLTYEKNGHLTDTLKDFIVQAFYPEYQAFVNRHKKLIPGGISQVNRQSNITL